MRHPEFIACIGWTWIGMCFIDVYRYLCFVFLCRSRLSSIIIKYFDVELPVSIAVMKNLSQVENKFIACRLYFHPEIVVEFMCTYVYR